MATETEFHHQNPRSVSVSEMLDRDSVSFGRFASESLAWEKWSVFAHNRYQEELQRFNFPGFVAQKKAYFEEYYKKVRTAKALSTAENNDSESRIVSQAEAGGIDADFAKDDLKEIQRSENDTSVDSDKQEADADGFLLTPGTRSSGISQRSRVLDSDSTELVASKSITQGNADPTRSVTKRESGCKNDGAVISKEVKPSPHETGNKLMSSFDGKNSQQKTNSKVRDSTDKFRRSVSHNKSPQCSLKKLGSDDLLTKEIDNRLKIPTPRNEVNLKSVGPSRKSYDRETKKVVEGENKIRVTTRRASKSSTTTPSSNHENLKPIHKGTKLTGQAQAQRVEARNKIPTWR